MKVGSHQDESVSLLGYGTFSWITDDPLILAAGDQAEISPLSKKKIIDAIAATLQAKGYVLSTDRDAADFVVSYTIGTRERISASSYPHRYGGDWGWDLYGHDYYNVEVQEHSYTEGTLGVDIFDGDSNQPVWHGWVSKTISMSDRQNPSPAIEKAVDSVLALFPNKAE